MNSNSNCLNKQLLKDSFWFILRTMWLKLCKSVLARFTWALVWNGILSRRVRISSAVLTVWEYRISNPLELVAVWMYLPFSGILHSYSCYVHSFSLSSDVHSRTDGIKYSLMYTWYQIWLWVIQFLSPSTDVHSSLRISFW